MSEMFEAADEIVDEAFPPSPGGLVDKHRKRKAAEEAQREEEKEAKERIEQPAFRAVKVASQSPDTFSGNIITIAAGAAGMVLPLSPYRYSATMRILTAASSVILAKDSSAATSQLGYTMLTADPPYVTRARGQLWAYNPGGATVQICVLSEIYAPET